MRLMRAGTEWETRGGGGSSQEDFDGGCGGRSVHRVPAQPGGRTKATLALSPALPPDRGWGPTT